MLKSKKKQPRESIEAPLLITCVVVLFLIGITMLYSTTNASHGYALLIKQMVFGVIGATGAFIIYRIPYRNIVRYAFFFLILVAGGLIYLFLARQLHENFGIQLPLAKSTKGAYRWIKLSFISIQVSEFGKVVIILYLSMILEKNQVYFNKFWPKCETFWKSFKVFVSKVVWPFLVVGGVVLLIFLGKNLSVTIVSTMIIATMAIVAGLKIRWFTIIIIGAIVVFTLDHYVLKTNIILPPYRIKRLVSFQEPEKLKKGAGMQLWRSQLALGSGGLTGKGITNGVMKNKIPEAHTDFILSIVGEELGYINLLLVLILYITITICGFRIAGKAVDRQGALLAIGFSTSILFHAFVNFSVMCGLFPTTGLTAPFVSYGGSSLVANLIGVGFILSVARQSQKKKR